MQESEDVLGLLVQHVGEAIKQVPYCNDDISLDSKVNVGAQESEEQVNVLLADLRGNAHVLAKRQDG